jgi:hypothetical protein
MDHYTGPATVLSPGTDIEIMVDLRSTTGLDRRVVWAGRIDAGERSCLARAVKGMSHYGLVLRLADGREGHFIPEGPITWSSGGINVRGFLRGEQSPHAW